MTGLSPPLTAEGGPRDSRHCVLGNAVILAGEIPAEPSLRRQCLTGWVWGGAGGTLGLSWALQVGRRWEGRERDHRAVLGPA